MKFSEEVHFVINQIHELSAMETFDIMKLRSEVFVEEQQCIYLDPDINDADALHLRGLALNKKLVAYARIYKSDCWHIGRIATAKSSRGMGLGAALVNQSIDYCKSKSQAIPMEMSAQVYLTDFYTSLGFEPIGNMYLEDGIPHLIMRYQE